VSAGLFTFVFGRVAKLPSNGFPYFAFSYAGLLGWGLFSTMLSNVSSSLNSNSTLISKIYFPRLVLPFSTNGSTFISTGISFAMMLVILAIYDIGFSVRILVLPFWLLLAMMLAMGLGLAFGSSAVLYRDVNYLTPMFTQLLLFLSPVAYGIEAVPQDLRRLYLLNPFTTIVSGCRWSLLGEASLSKWAIVYTSVLALGVLSIGLANFARLESSFADVI
jgi:lipopolysaccharide transport system permease protein